MRHRHSRSSLLVILCVCVLPSAQAQDFEQEPISYSTATPANAVSRLQEKLDRGEVALEHDEHSGYLRSLLSALEVPAESQMLVFSKTSLQRQRINPRKPRAVYFGDDAYVGFCQQGEVLEVTAVDPQLGAVFYTLDQEAAEAPRLVRQTDTCLACHENSRTNGIPGHLVRSVFPDASGLPELSLGSHKVDHTTPLKDRWGGWYVTGTHGDQVHLGGIIVKDKTMPDPARSENLNVEDLGSRIDTAAYLTPHSDIVALMVLEHQTEMHNRITAANFQTRSALYQEASLDEAFERSTEELSESTLSRIANAGDRLLEYMLFCDEAALTAPIRGTSNFAAEFAAKGLRDSHGRSLRDFDLERRLFRYPCSYVVHTEAFRALPIEIRRHIAIRLHAILSGADTDEKFAHLTAADRAAILEILTETEPELAALWIESAAQ